MIVLSLDSGIERTGYAVFEKDSSEYSYITCGIVLTSKKDTLPTRLHSLATQLEDIISLHKPNIMIVEQLFFNTNAKTAITVAQAQGASMLTAARHNIPVEFLSPLTVKQVVTGDGRADKKQIQKMLEFSIKFEEKPETDDVYDAVACGLAYCILSKSSRSEIPSQSEEKI